MTLSPALVIEADGGSRGNPGVGGYGALVRDARSGKVLAERAAPLGKVSNNVAEYQGLIAGLTAVLDLGLAERATVEVRMDSKLVVEQMAGRWKIKHADMQRLALEARRLIDRVQQAGGRVDFTWIPRDKNKAADALSNDGMDGKTVHRDHGVDRAAEPVAAPEVEAVETVTPAAASAWAEDGMFSFDEPDASQDGSREIKPSGAEKKGSRPAFGVDRVPLTDLYVSDETVPTLEGETKLILVRHGVTDFTQTARLDGRGGSDPSLNGTGQAQARAAAQAVKRLIDRSEPSRVSLVSSSLQRARQTGEAIAEALGVEREEDRDWDEQGFGEWDGKSMTELIASNGEDLLRMRSDLDFAPPAGESRREVDRRVGEALGRALQRGGTVVVATHRVVLMSVLCRVLGIGHERGWSIATAPTSLTAIEVWPDGGAQVAFVNDTHHLYEPAVDRTRPTAHADVRVLDSSLD